MKFKEYLKFYKRNSLTKIELEVFGIPRLVVGWKVLYANLEITEEMLEKVMSNTSMKKTHRKVAKRLFKKEDQRENYKVETDKLLYLAESSTGLLKIGISVNPTKRVRQLTTACGVPVTLLGVWDVELNARMVEFKMHKAFEDFRLEGEWFTKNSFTLEEFEDMIPCAREKILC